MNIPPALPSKEKIKKLNVKRTLALTFGASLIFLTGVGIGSGRIALSRDQLFRKSVQKNLPANLDYSSVEQVYDMLRRDFDGQLDTQKLLDGLKAGLAQATGDEYTQYLSADEAKEFDEGLNGTFTGIGARLLEKDDLVTIEVPLAGYPAERAGLKAKDVIIEINGESAVNMTVAQAVEKIRGEAGTKVKLKIVRNSSEQLEFEITREKITVPSVESEILEGNIGYLQVNQFNKDTADLAREAAAEFKEAGVKGVILDVRNNPGGLLDSAVSLSNLWLEPGKTILVEKRDNLVVNTYKVRDKAVLGGVPTVVLVNEGSASASEILAGALKDHGVATLMGTKSFGKGSVQQLEELGNGGILKVTIARWFTPKGTNIHKEGIKPDTEVKLDEEKFKAGIDNQLDAAKAELLK